MVYEETRVSLTRNAAKKAGNVRDKVMAEAKARNDLEKEEKAAAKARQQDLQEACNRAESTNSRGEASTAADAKSSRVPGDDAANTATGSDVKATTGEYSSALQGLDSDPDKGRLNVRRVKEWISPKNPEFEALMRLAQPPDLDNPGAGGGVRIALPPGFIPNSGVDQSLPRPNPKTLSTQHALRRMIQEGFRDNRLCFILTEEKAREVLPEFHCSPAQWAPKFWKPLGRSCNCLLYTSDAADE